MEAKIEEQRAEALRRESRALLAWSNTWLGKRKLKAEVVDKDFADGVLLINLVEEVFGASLGKFNMTPKMSIHKMENIGKAFEWLEKECKIVMQGIDPNDLVKKQEKPTVTVLWNMMFGSAMRGMGHSGADASAATMRDTLLKWVNSVLSKDGIDIKLLDFWDSWKDGIFFCTIVEHLAPGSIDLKSLSKANAEQNLTLAFTTAETKLGIPPLLTAADMVEGTRPDERSVMNYVCMLVSVGQGAAQKTAALEELERKAAAEKAAKLAEMEHLKQEMQAQLEREKQQRDEEKKRMEEELAASMSKFAGLGKEKEASEAEKKALEQSFKNMQETHSKALEGFDKERMDFRAIIDDLRRQIAALEAQLAAERQLRASETKDLQDRLTETQAALYASHKEHEELVENIRSRLNQRALQERVVQDEQQTTNKFAQLLKDAITQQKSFKDFVNSLPNTQGWLLKKRPENVLTGSVTHKRFFTLKGEILHWGESEDRPFDKSAELNKYLMIDRTGMGEQQTADAAVLSDSSEKKEGKTEDRRRRSSVMTYKKGKAVMRLVPRDQKKDSILELMSLDPGDTKEPEKPSVASKGLAALKDAVPGKKKEEPVQPSVVVHLPGTEAPQCDDINQWVDTVNTRISLLRYLDNFTQATLNRGGREVIGFICDPDQTELKIVDKVADVHAALTHFKEPLQHRKGLCLTFNNIAMSDADLEVVCDIVETNDTMKALCFQQNLISAQGATRLAKALKKNKSIISLQLDLNNIKDDGLVALAEAVYYHRNLGVLSLTGNKIGDSGCTALMTAMMDSQKKWEEPHHMKHLQLANNLIGDPGAKALARMIRKNDTVEMISLNSNLLTDKGVGYIIEVAEKHALPIKSLMLAQNQISSKTLVKLAEYLGKVNHEIELDLSFNKLVTGKGVMALLQTPVPFEIQEFSIIKKDRSAPVEEENLETGTTAAAAEVSVSVNT